jgi:hypothetical protein
VQYLKWKPKDQNMIASLQFLGSAMHILKRKNPLTESFLAQLEVDLEGTGIVIGPKALSPWSKGGDTCPADVQEKRKAMFSEISLSNDPVKCSPLYEIRDSQTQAVNNAVFRPSIPHTSSGGDFAAMSSNVDLGVETTFADFSANSASHFMTQLPSRSKGNSPYGPGVTFEVENSATPSTTDMDYSATDKSRSSSYKDSSSHASFTPPSGTLDDQRSHHSPPTIGSTPNPLAHDGMFLGVSDNNFANFLGSQMFGATPYTTTDPKITQQGWDFGAVEVGTGLTPMSETQWNDLSQGQTSWGGMQPTTPFTEDGRRR